MITSTPYDVAFLLEKMGLLKAKTTIGELHMQCIPISGSFC